MDCLVKRLDCFVVIQVKVTEKVQNCREYSSGWYLLSCWTFSNQTLYGGATSWAKCYARRLVCCLQAQGHIERSFNQIWLFLPYLLNCWSFYNQIYWMVLIISFSDLCKKFGCCFQGQDHSEDSKLYWICLYLTSSVLLISWQAGRCADLLKLGTQRKGGGGVPRKATNLVCFLFLCFGFVF